MMNCDCEIVFVKYFVSMLQVLAAKEVYTVVSPSFGNTVLCLERCSVGSSKRLCVLFLVTGSLEWRRSTLPSVRRSKRTFLVVTALGALSWAAVVGVIAKLGRKYEQQTKISYFYCLRNSGLLVKVSNSGGNHFDALCI